MGLLTLLLPLSAKAQEEVLESENRVWITGRVFWDTTSANWDAGSLWANDDTAEFNQGTGVVLIPERVSASGLVFNTTSTIADGSITLSGISPSITVASGETATIGSMLNTLGDLTIVNAGTAGDADTAGDAGIVILSGAYNLGGNTTITNNAWLGIETSGTLGTALEVESNGTLSLGGVDPNTVSLNATLSIAGTGAEESDGAIHVNAPVTNASLSGTITLLDNATIGSSGRLTLGSAIDTAGHVLSVNATRSGLITLNGPISGIGGGVTYDGGGTITLGISNTYQGATTIINGTRVTAASDDVFGSDGSRTSLAIDDSSGSSNSFLNLNGTSQSITSLSGDATSSIILGDGDEVGSGTLTIGFDSALNPSGIARADFAGILSGEGTLIKDGPSTQILSGANTFTGATTIDAGTLEITNALGLGATGSASATTVADGATLLVNGVTISGETLTIAGSGVNSPSGALSGGSSTSSFNGPILLSQGASIHNSLGGTLSLGDSITTQNRELTLAGGGTINVNGSIVGDASGFDDSLVLTGGGTVNLNAPNTFVGPTLITEGTTVNTNAAEAFPQLNGRSNLTLEEGSTLNLSGLDQAVASLAGDTQSTIALDGSILTVGSSADASPGTNFEGVISGAGTLVKDGTTTQILSGPNTFEGITTVNSGTLTIANGTALGSTGSPDSITTVSGGATLALQGGIQAGERVILYNDARLRNNSGDNTISNLLLVEHDIHGTSAGQKFAHIGAQDGQLNLTGGIDDFAGRFSSSPEMNLRLNTEEGDNGVLHIDSVIGPSIADIHIGRSAENEPAVGRVILSGNNQLSGDTYLEGGLVQLGTGGTNSRAFGDSAVTVSENSSLLGAENSTSGAELLNPLNITAGAILRTQDTLSLGGAISGSGSLNVGSGTLSLFGDSNPTWRGSTSIEPGATLVTLNPERISDSSALTVDGILSLGGNETVNDLSGSGTITNNGNDLTVTQTSDQEFSGTITGAGGLTTQGEAGLTLTNGSDFTGAANVNEGTLTLSGALATNTINVASGATLTTTAADLLSDGATLTNDGTLNLGGDDTITNLFGSETGTINLGVNNLLLLGGNYFEGRINGEGAVSAGPGDINLGGDNTFTGDLTVLSGSTTTLTGSADGNVTIAAGGELTLGSAERIADTATLTLVTSDTVDPSGILNLNGTERVTILQSGGVIRGPGLINAETYNLTDGAITEQGADLGNGTLNSDGTVLLGGDSFAGTANVRSGILTLNGSLIYEPALTVNVEPAGTLVLGFDERIGDNAISNINGTLTLNGTETVTTFNLNGPGSTLNGSGLVLAETYNLANGATTEEGANLGPGPLNSDGAAPVTLNGNSASSDVNINSGIFNLNGELTDVFDLTVSGGATVNLGSDERINDPTTVNILPDGALNLNGTETVRSYNSSGTLGLSPGATSGTLLVTESPINLMDGHLSLNGTNLQNLGGQNPQLTSNGDVVISGTAGTTSEGPDNATINVGALDIETGTLTLNGLLTNPEGIINIRPGATLVSGSSNRINGDSSTLNLEAGATWTLGGDDTIGTFNASGLLNGQGTLTADIYNLSDGAVTEVLANLGSGTLNSDGSAVLNGDAAVETANVNSGLLNLNGQLTDVVNLTIADGGTLVSGSPDRINDDATGNIATGGSWILNGNDTIATLNSGGLLNGTGTLTAETYNLTDGAVTDILANLGSGTLNSDESVTLNGNAAVETANVNSGTLALNGQLTDVTTLNISESGTLLSGGAERINNAATANITTGGTLTLNDTETIAALNSGGLLNGSGTLTAETYNLTDGAVTETLANLGAGILNSDGAVTLNGDAAAGTTNVNTGTLNLNGQLTAVGELNISEGATLINGSAERINDAAVVNNAGTMTLAEDENVTTLNADGGLLDGSGLLTAETYNLSNGTATAAGADLGTGTLNSGPGEVTLDGNTNADAINIESGALNTNGAVQNQRGVITVASEATWNVNSSYTYDTLRGEGTVDPGGLNGNTFRNENTISPGSALGTLTIAGDYIESGIYHAQLDQAPVSDTLQVTGSVTLEADSRLDLSEFSGLVNGSGAVLCGERWNIIDTPGVINGEWGEISDVNNPGALGQTFQSQLLFDRGTGDLVSLGLQDGQTVADYAGISEDQARILSAVLEGATGNDLIVGNFNSEDDASGTLLNTIYTAAPPGDKAGLYNAINSLSPEAFAGAVDYALVATRGYVESALGYRPRSREDVIIISEDDTRGSIATPLFRSEENIETFAGFSNVQVGSSSSQSGNDYSLQSSGIYAGGRLLATDSLVLSSYIAADVGSISSSTIDLDTHGLIVGASFDYSPVGPDHPLRIIGTASYANYEYDGHRQSVAGRYQIPEIDANAFEAGIRVEYGLINNDGWSIIPAIGLRHLSAHTDAFSELGGPGALFMGEHEDAASLVDLGVFANYQQFGKPYGFNAELRWQHDFADAHRDIDAVFAASGTAFDVTAPGMGSDALIFSLGSYYDVDERYRIGFNYRGERRSDADMLHSFNLRIMAGF